MKTKECKHSKLIKILNLETRELIGGGDLSWCKTCGCIMHIDLDDKIRVAIPTYQRKSTKAGWG